MNRADEEPRRRARIFDANHTGARCVLEVVLDDLDAAARRAVLVESEVTRVHEDGDVLGEDVLREGDELFGDAAEHIARIGLRRVDGCKLENERRRLERKMHRFREQRVLRWHVAQQRRRRDAELGRDVRERRPFEPLRCERLARDGEQTIAADDRRASH